MNSWLKFAGPCARLLLLPLGVIAAVVAGCQALQEDPASPLNVKLPQVETKAVAFLQVEVPKWSRENGCFSCHNNGDAARALFAAVRLGAPVPTAALADTIVWLNQPQSWSYNKGDPGFSDQRLADIQFAAALQASLRTTPRESQSDESRAALHHALARVAAGQDLDGSWRIEAQNPVGSPTTYGTALATYVAWRSLRDGEGPEVDLACRKAARWLHQLAPSNVPSAAVIILAATHQGAGEGVSVGAAIEFLKRAQTQSGGWGPYADGPPEVFDTALALLAFSRAPGNANHEWVRRGRDYLAATQLTDGSWPATTRPSGGASYAQGMSTTGWATLALLATLESPAR